MPSSLSKQEECSYLYAIAIEACCELAQAYFYLGKLAQAQHLLRALLHLIEASEAMPQARLKLVLLYGQILTTGFQPTVVSTQVDWNELLCYPLQDPTLKGG